SEEARPSGRAFLRLCKRAGARPAGLISAAPSGILHVPVPPDGGSILSDLRMLSDYEAGAIVGSVSVSAAGRNPPNR
ncbi:TPA: hypothetical protein ACYYID_000001, partial [Salmonella enterica subsp. arizonae serovar -:z4,z24:-]